LDRLEDDSFARKYAGMKRRMWPMLLIATGLTFLAGCISMTRRLEVSAVKQIVVGKTSQEEVERDFGRPHEKITGAGGLTVTRYFFHEIHKSTDVSWHVRNEHPGDVLFRTLTLSYAPDKTVARKLHDESFTPVFRTNAWYFVGPMLTADSVSFITKNGSTELELVRRLGAPAGRTFDLQGHNVLFWFHGRGRETRLTSLETRKLIVVLDTNSLVRDYVLVEQPILDVKSPPSLQ
jgi:hypothetical protein